MNSLEFIKMHVDEWPNDTFSSVKLLVNGCAWFFDISGNLPSLGGLDVDLSEHFAPDYYDGVVWTRKDFESFGNGGGSSTEWEDTSVCYADGQQWVYFDNYLLTKDKQKLASYEEILQYEDFQLNEIQQGDCILVDEIDDEDEYNNVVDVFMLFVFPRWEDAGFEDTKMSKWLVVDRDKDLVGAYLISDCQRMVTYNQLITIGKLKKILNDCHNETVCGKPKADFIKAINKVNALEADEKLTLWSPTINSIVDVGDCEGVVKAIDGEQYWVLKDTSMYETYHKGSLKKPLTEEEKLYKDVVSNIMGAAFVRSSVAEQLIQDLDKRGYKIVRKED